MFEWRNKNKSSQVELVVSNKTVIRVLALVIISFMFLAALKQAAHALTLIFMAFFLSIALNAPVQWLSSKMPGRLHGSRVAATGISFLIVVALLGLFLATLLPPLIRQTSSFLAAAPQLVEDAREGNGALGAFIRENNLQNQIDGLSGELSDRLHNIGGTAFSAASKIGGSVFSTLTVLVLTFMMLVEGPAWIKLFRKLIPKPQRPHTDELLSDMYEVVKGYVNGQVLLATIAALLILVPLIILGISYPVALMVIVFVCGLIPMVGHYIGASIVTAVALFTSPWDAAIILAYYVVYQQIENYVIQPSIQSNATNMSPLLVFSSVIIGVSFGGLLGGLVAIPIAGCLRILVLDYLKSRNLIEREAVTEYTKATTEPTP